MKYSGTDEFDILQYKWGEHPWQNHLTKAEKIEDLEERMSRCAYYIEAWTDAYNQLREEMLSLERHHGQ
tara:strand:- start:671 stop:877 length:207 start_codon:yes stop_codon:yes gene_type:complete